MEYKEYLLYFFLQGSIRLSHADHKFLTNLQVIIHDHKRVTSNQSFLFDKLTIKYKKQLSKHGIPAESLIGISWKIPVIESSEEFTGANVMLDNDMLVLKVPFNRTFIFHFKMLNYNPFEWCRDTKTYTAIANTYSLKVLKETLPNYFPSVRYCDTLTEILTDLNRLNAEHWNPTLVKINGNLIVIALNSVLGELISTMELKEDVHTFFALSQLGIDIHPSLVVDDRTKFASEFITEIELDDFPTVIEWMQELNIETTILGPGLTLNTPIKQYITSLLKNTKESLSQRSTNCLPIMLQYYNTLITRRYHASEPISKCVMIKNSKPIDVK